MSKIAFSIRVYSFYLFLMGAGMMFFPNQILPIFGFAATTEIWIRMLGLFTFTTGIYYYGETFTGLFSWFIKSGLLAKMEEAFIKHNNILKNRVEYGKG